MYTVLVVDDEQIEREGISGMLGWLFPQLQILTAENGEKALEVMRKEDTQVDILLADIRMPFLDGLTLSEIVRKEWDDIFIVLISSYGDFEYTQKAVRVQVDDYLLKPVDENEFCRVINQALETLDRKGEELSRKKKLLDDYHSASFYRKDQILEKLLSGEYDETEEEKGQERNAVQMAVRLIEEHFTENISVEWVAEQLYFSAGYLSAIFKKETGQSVLQYITRCRLQKAEELLRSTNKKIADISREVGYDNPSYFGLIFKKTFGITPLQMRQGEDGCVLSGKLEKGLLLHQNTDEEHEK